MDRDIIGRGTWIDKVSSDLIEKEKKLDRSLDLIVTESGLGASGIPHVGSIADAIRSYAVTLALRDMGYSSKTIAFSDDMDGLRKIPTGLPSTLERHLLKPVSMIPDPFSCHESYAAHMSGLLIEALDECDIEYEIGSGREIYESGKMAPFIEKILIEWERVGKKIEELTGQEKFTIMLPYFAICSRCGRIYTTHALSYDKKTKKVRYICRGTEIRDKKYKGCGHQGEADIRRANGKLNWKAEFAARWALLDIRFEAYGKDIADSVEVNDWVSREVLGFEPPMHVRYEMFLDVMGRKISKSIGNVFTPQIWLRYGSPESLILYMLKRFRGTRRTSLETVKKTMLELDHLKDMYFGRVKIDNLMKLAKTRGLLEYAYRLASVEDVGTPYGLVLNLAVASPEGSEFEFIASRLRAYGYVEEEVPTEVEKKIVYAVNWVTEVEKRLKRAWVETTDKEKEALKDLIEKISDAPNGDYIQNKVFEVVHRHGLKTREFFPILYEMLLGRGQGPRIGPLIMDMGPGNVSKILRTQIEATA
ncbi:MAG: lysine--tRNA ligase [Nitrososphaeria archaeon]|nr:lysine--tRNA ligase [Nitrososphaeria archaeon]NIN52049.1 lysine--tRNA ligase [Nitrososphaeria archaeon]NIQ32510.1 lysine--tRNA ligase [Nitrososphaeria archaeon]